MLFANNWFCPPKRLSLSGLKWNNSCCCVKWKIPSCCQESEVRMGILLTLHCHVISIFIRQHVQLLTGKWSFTHKKMMMFIQSQSSWARQKTAAVGNNLCLTFSLKSQFVWTLSALSPSPELTHSNKRNIRLSRSSESLLSSDKFDSPHSAWRFKQTGEAVLAGKLPQNPAMNLQPTGGSNTQWVWGGSGYRCHCLLQLFSKWGPPGGARGRCRKLEKRLSKMQTSVLCNLSESLCVCWKLFSILVR